MKRILTADCSVWWGEEVLGVGGWDFLWHVFHDVLFSGETRILKRCIKFHHFYLPFVRWHPLGFTEGFSLNGLFAGQTGDLCNSWSKIRTHIIKMIKHSFPSSLLQFFNQYK